MSSLKDRDAKHKQANNIFIKACKDGKLSIVKKMLTSPNLDTHADIHVKNDLGLQCACRFGHFEIVKYLLSSPELNEHANLHVDDDVCFRDACYGGFLDIVKFLLTSPDLKEHSNIHAANDCGIIGASVGDEPEIVEYLIFDMNIPHTKAIDEHIKENPGDLICKMLLKRKLENQLNQDVSFDTINTSKNKNKI